MLALFFGSVALARGVGMYGVFDYSVLQRTRETGIRIAIGAQAGHIAQSVMVKVFAGIATVRFFQTSAGRAAMIEQSR